VIQKCIEEIPVKYLDFIIKTLEGKIIEFSTHPYGCRVIQRLLECCSTDPHCHQKLMPLLNEILQHVLLLSRDQYGNYVIQHVLSHGPSQARSSIVEYVCQNMLQMSKHKFSSNVVEKCFMYALGGEKDILLDHLLQIDKNNSSPLVEMVRDPFGNYVIQKILEVTTVAQRNRLINHLIEFVPNLSRLMFGKHIIAKIEKITGTNYSSSS